MWLNPPYHRVLQPLFITKLIEEINAGRVVAAIVLTNNSTDTEWFRVAVRACASVCFTDERIKFTVPIGEPVKPTQGQSLFYFGTDVEGFEAVFCTIGYCMRLSREYAP